jgi:hypothetical protein
MIFNVLHYATCYLLLDFTHFVTVDSGVVAHSYDDRRADIGCASSGYFRWSKLYAP